MNFSQAMQELKQGNRIRRRAWEPLMHLVMVDNVIRTYKAESSIFMGNPQVLLSDGWMVKGDEEAKTFDFVEAVEHLRQKKHLINVHEGWLKDSYIFIDGDAIAHCHPVAYVFMPTFQCMCAHDWELLR